MAEASTDGKESLNPEVSSQPNLITKQKGFHLIDLIFPIYDQMMQVANYPSWVSSVITIFISLQMVFVSLWVYSPAAERTTGSWTKVYKVILSILAFQDPLDNTTSHMDAAYACLAVSIITSLWLVFMIFFHYKFYIIPRILTHISVFVLDVLEPIFLIPSCYVLTHGVYALQTEYNSDYISEIIIGLVCFLTCSYHFYNGIFMKSRSVVLTNLTFQLYDYFAVFTWFGFSTCELILSPILRYFPDWYFIPLIFIHFLVAFYCSVRIAFFPFYTLFRNPTCMAIAIVTYTLDLSLLVLCFAKNLSYNYIIIAFLFMFLISYPLSRLYFSRQENRIKKQLSYTDDYERNITEYFNSLPILKHPLYTQMYVVVGMGCLCDYFVDGSLTDYIINNDMMESSLATMLQVVTYFPSYQMRLNQLYKILQNKRKLTFVNRFLIYQISKIRTRRLTTSNKDSLDALNRVKLRNEECKLAINSFWDKTSCTSAYMTEISQHLFDTNNYFK